jgi:hypothetical protein
MKRLYGLVFLLAMPCIDAMQKKAKPHKKFNIHNTQKKNGKKYRRVQVRQEQHERIQRQDEKINERINIARYGSHEQYMYARASSCAALLFPVAIVASLVYKKCILGMPIDCIPMGYGVMKCLDV